MQSLPVRSRLPTSILAKQQTPALDPSPERSLEPQSPHAIIEPENEEPEDALESKDDAQLTISQQDSNPRDNDAQYDSDQYSLMYDNNWGGDDEEFQDSGFRGETQQALLSKPNSRQQSEIRSESSASLAPSLHRTYTEQSEI
jgi:hypothetical protein